MAVANKKQGISSKQQGISSKQQGISSKENISKKQKAKERCCSEHDITSKIGTSGDLDVGTPDNPEIFSAK
ncbi:MAG: hypothetical protein R2794_02440 [Chitinophagales bacterium]